MKKILTTSLLSISLLSILNANNLENHTSFRGESNIVESQESWYRELRMNSWIKLGAKEKTIKTVLRKITSNTPIRDLDNSDKETNWTYEFSKEAKKVYSNAKTYKELREASALYLIASYPNLLSKHELKALKSSLDIYVEAEKKIGNNTKIISMNGTTGIIHFPKEMKSKVPVILWTGGVDKALVTHLPSIKKYVNSGIAVITFDMAGAGLNKDSITKVGNEDIMHQKAYEFVKKHPLLDESRIAALSSSGAGVSLMEFAIKRPELKAVIARCAMIDGPLSKPFLIKKVPLMSAHAFGKRIGVDINNLDSFANKMIPLSLKTKGYLDGKTYMNTPLLVINTQDDPIASPVDMKKNAKISSNGSVEFYGKEGHCPDGKEAENAIFNFILKNI